MNADIDLLNEGINKWEVTDIKSEDSEIIDDNIGDLEAEWESEEENELLCLLCDLEFFSHSQFLHHHLSHVALPTVLLTPIGGNILSRLSAGKSVKKRPGPKSKTLPENLPSDLLQSPLKLRIKRSSCHEHGFEVVNKKKGRVKSCAAMDEMIAEGRNSPSPTPSDILRPEVNAESHRSSWESLAISFGFLAPEALDSPADPDLPAEAVPSVNGDDVSTPSSPPASAEPENGRQEDSGASSTTASEPDTSLPPPFEPPTPQPEPPLENGTSELDSETETQKNVEQESSDSGYEKDGSEKDFPSERTAESTPPPPPTPPIGILRVKGPSALNSSVVNGSLPPEPLDSNAVSEAFSSLNNEPSEPAPLPPTPPVREGLSLKSPADLYPSLEATSGPSVSLLNLNPPGSDPLGLLRGYMDSEAPPYMLEACEVCGERSENMEQHRAAMGHYKCHMSLDCAVVLFTSAQELRNHQHVTHGVLPPPTPPPPQPSLQQLAQQVQRLPVPYGMVPEMGTPPPAVSPGFQKRNSPVASPGPAYKLPGSVTLSYPQPPQGAQGIIQARPFAMATSPSSFRPDGSPVALPVPGLGRSISISPSTKPAQKRATSSPVVETSKRSRAESPDCELVDVQQKMPSLPSSISLTVRGSGDSPGPVRHSQESSGVANILASRGITVTPAVNKAAAAPSSRASVTAAPSPVTTLNLSSAVSIVPASQARQREFAVPAGRGRAVDRTVKPPTVDLTQDSPPTFSRRNRPQRFTCQVCDKVFTSQETLNQHLTTHRSPGKLPYKCNLCNAQYPTQQGMLQHKQTYHKEAQGSEMALPVVDIKHPGTIQKLSSLGIRHCLILSQLGNSSGGVFGLPIVAIDNARNPAICNLGALGASNVLSLGPAKALR